MYYCIACFKDQTFSSLGFLEYLKKHECMPVYQQQDLRGQGSLCSLVSVQGSMKQCWRDFIAGKKILSLCRELGRTNKHRGCMSWNKMPAVAYQEFQSPEQLGGAP